MERQPLWIGEVGIVRALFAHAAHADDSGLLTWVREVRPEHAITGVGVELEVRLGRRRRDAVLTCTGATSDGRPGTSIVVVEAKVGALVDNGTLGHYVGARGPAVGVLVAAYMPAGELPAPWRHADLEETAEHLRCKTRRPCPVCDEIRFAVAHACATKRVWWLRQLAETARTVEKPAGWSLLGEGSSVGRPLVFFASPYVNEEWWRVHVELGLSKWTGRLEAAVMLAAEGVTGSKVSFPEAAWHKLGRAARGGAPPLPEGVADTSLDRYGGSTQDRAQLQLAAAAAGCPAAWTKGYNMKGWHARGRKLHHAEDNPEALLAAAFEQGQALYEVSSALGR